MHTIQKEKLSRNKRGKKGCFLEKGLFGQEIVNDTEGDTSFINSMKFFEGCLKTEGAFYIRFQQLPLSFKKSLQRYYNTDKNWQIFKEIKKFYKVSK